MKVLIIGQGLAGSFLGFSLLERNIEVVITDHDHPLAASRVAGGMWNPASFKRLTSSWNVQEFLPVMFRRFTALEKALQAKFFHPTPLYRIHATSDEVKGWEERTMHFFLDQFYKEHASESVEQSFHCAHGNSLVAEAGWVNIPVFLEAARAFFQNQGVFRKIEIKEEELKNTANDTGVIWNDETFDYVVVCTGNLLSSWESFKQIPIIPNIGEVLEVASDMPLNTMVNFGKFMIPLGNKRFRLGATYLRDSEFVGTTDEGKNDLMTAYREFAKFEAEVTDHKAGIRPTTHDRKPVLGKSLNRNRFYCFGGLGSKGVMLAPFFSETLTESLIHQTELPKEISTHRYS